MISREQSGRLGNFVWVAGNPERISEIVPWEARQLAQVRHTRVTLTPFGGVGY